MANAKKRIRQPGTTAKLRTSPTSIDLYTQKPMAIGTEGKRKVTVTVNGSLLQAVDEYVHGTDTNRSAIFEQALLLWCQWRDEQADAEYYENLSEADRAANESWRQVTTEAAKHIWKP